MYKIPMHVKKLDEAAEKAYLPSEQGVKSQNKTNNSN